MEARQGHLAAALREVEMSFGDVRVLQGVNLSLAGGEVLGLVGENGAGKSTIVNLFSGNLQPTSGSIELDGLPTVFLSPSAALRAGIAVIHQEPALFATMSVAENIFMHRQPSTLSGISWSTMRRGAEKLLRELDVDLDVKLPVSALSAAHRQLVEIAKALSVDAKILILDEPTASLSGKEVEDLLTIVRRLRDRGVAIMLITHRLDEIFAVCDQISVLRDGNLVADGPASEFDRGRLIGAMVGRPIDALYPKSGTTPGDVILKVTDLTSIGKFSDVTFSVRSGEIVGMAGLVGAGRTEIARCVFGIDGYSRGTVEIEGRPLPSRKPKAAVDAGLAFVPEDRRGQGLVMELPIVRNIGITILNVLTSWGLVKEVRERQYAQDYFSRLRIRATGIQQIVGTLSGGNQQKVVLGKWLARTPKLLILDEPTRGIDVGTKAEVYRLIADLAHQGLAILLISSELPEILGMSDRILVVAEGHITAEIPAAQATAEAVMAAATDLSHTGKGSVA